MPSDDDEVSPVPVQDGQDESDEAQEDRRDHDSLSASTLRLPGRVFWTRNTSFLSEKVSWFCSDYFNINLALRAVFASFRMALQARATMRVMRIDPWMTWLTASAREHGWGRPTK